MAARSHDGVLIGVDWGTSSFRACLMGNEGRILDEYRSDQGILNLRDGSHENILEDAIGRCGGAGANVPVIVSGMITSRNGWVETDYLPLPAGIDDLASGLTTLTTRSGRKIHFVNGLAHSTATARPDVIRGEETELAGMLAGNVTGVFVLPGTHSKWVWVDNGKIIDFETYMTGEFFGILRNHSILGKLAVDGSEDMEAFLGGVRLSTDEAGSVLGKAFSARTLVLLNRMKSDQIPDYLSGLLIGDEYSSGLGRHPDSRKITLIGREELVERYRAAAALLDLNTAVMAVGMAQRGQWKIARHAGLV